MPRLMSFWVVVSLSHLHEVGLARRRSLERALAEQVVHEGADVEPDLRPQRLVVGLEDDPLRAAVEALLDEERGAPHRDVLLLVGELVGAPQRARAPDDAARRGNVRRQLMPSGLSCAVLAVGELDARAPATPTSVASSPAGAFQTPRCGIGAGEHRRRRRRTARSVSICPSRSGFGLTQAREVDGRITCCDVPNCPPTVASDRGLRPSSQAAGGSTTSIARRCSQ